MSTILSQIFMLCRSCWQYVDEIDQKFYSEPPVARDIRRVQLIGRSVSRLSEKNIYVYVARYIQKIFLNEDIGHGSRNVIHIHFSNKDADKRNIPLEHNPDAAEEQVVMEATSLQSDDTPADDSLSDDIPF
jgi:hypothetical protein